MTLCWPQLTHWSFPCKLDITLVLMCAGLFYLCISKTLYTAANFG